MQKPPHPTTPGAPELAGGVAQVLAAVPILSLLAPLVSALGRLVGAMGGGKAAVPPGVAALNAALNNLAASANKAASAIPGLNTLGPKGAPAGGTRGGTGGAGVPNLAGIGVPNIAGGANLQAGEGLADALGAVVGPAAAAAAGLVAVTVAAEHFGGLISPTALLLFQRAVKDTEAVLGVALLPVLRVMTDVVRGAGEAFLPVARQLAPIFYRLANTVGGQLSAGFDALAGMVSSALPLFDALAAANEVMVAVYRPLIEAVSLYADLLAPGLRQLAIGVQILLVPLQALANMVGDGVRALSVFTEGLAAAFSFGFDLSGILGATKDGAAMMREGFASLLKTLLLFSAAIAKSISPAFGDKYIAGMLKGLEGRQHDDIHGLRPAENAHVTGVEEFGKSLLAAASMASEFGKGKTDAADPIKSIEGQLRELMGSKDSIMTPLIKAMLNDLPPRIAAALRGQGKDFGDGVFNAKDHPPGTGGTTKGDLLKSGLVGEVWRWATR